MSSKRFNFRKKIIDTDDLLVSEEEAEIAKEVYHNWTEKASSSRISNQPKIIRIKGPAKLLHMAIQCSGITKSHNVQCKNMTHNENGYCHLH